MESLRIGNEILHVNNQWRFTQKVAFIRRVRAFVAIQLFLRRIIPDRGNSHADGHHGQPGK